MSRIVVGPFNRVEGDLEVALDVVDGRVREAFVNATLYRGFERILAGKAPLDALALTPRICGICSIAQSAASAAALADVAGIAMPPNGRRAVNLMMACENLADHYTHFHVFFMPDFARPAWASRPWHAAMRARFAAVHGESVRRALATRAGFMKLMGYLAGKWPHTLAIQPGGSQRAIERAERRRLLMLLAEFRAALEGRLFGDTLENIAALDGMVALERWMDAHPFDASDFRLFLEAAKDIGLFGLGRATGRFMSYGAYPDEAGAQHFARGLWRDGAVSPLDVALIAEDASHAWFDGGTLSPANGRTEPLAEKEGAYSWCKAPRLNGEVVETGALARQAVAGHPLALELVADGGSAAARVVARLIEIALVVPAMERWATALEPDQPFCNDAPMPRDAEGVGLVEAARGGLGHWLSVRDGHIANYQIVAPTTWNFSPRDAAGVPGAAEQALAGLPVPPGEDPPLLVQHVVRSFDPCMVCTVH